LNISYLINIFHSSILNVDFLGILGHHCFKQFANRDDVAQRST